MSALRGKAQTWHLTPRGTLMLLYVVGVMSGYGVAMFINGIGKQIAPSRSLLGSLTLNDTVLVGQGGLVGSSAGQSGSLAEVDVGLRVLAGVLPPMFSLATYRAAALLVLLLCMHIHTHVAAWRRARSARRSSDPSSPSPSAPSLLPDRLTPRVLIPVLIGMCNAGGYVFFMMLTSMTGVAVWSSLVGVYVVVPVGIGLVRGETAGVRKMLGIAACIVGALLLGLAQAAGAGNGKGLETPGYASALLFLACIGVWGICDSMCAYVHRGPHALSMQTIVGFSAVGFLLVAWMCSLVSHYITETVQARGSMVNTVTPASFWMGQLVLMIAQAIGIAAWFCTIKLGALSEASSFLPLTSLYTIFSAILGLIFMGETMPTMGYVGMAAAAVGGLLIATADGMDSPGDAAAASPTATQTMTLPEDAEKSDAAPSRGSESRASTDTCDITTRSETRVHPHPVEQHEAQSDAVELLLRTAGAAASAASPNVVPRRASTVVPASRRASLGMH